MTVPYIPRNFSRNCLLSFSLSISRSIFLPPSENLLRESLYLNTARPYLVGSTRQRIIRAHGGTFHLYTEGHTGIYAHTCTCIHTPTRVLRYERSRDGRRRRNDDRQTQRRRCMHLPKAVCDEGGVGGGGGDGALYRGGERSYRFWPCRAGGQIFPTPLSCLNCAPLATPTIAADARFNSEHSRLIIIADRTRSSLKPAYRAYNAIRSGVPRIICASLRIFSTHRWKKKKKNTKD